MLLDANVLVYAVDVGSPHHDDCNRWLTGALNGDQRVALPWQTIGAFVRITTHPKINTTPLTPPDAWSFVDEWLSLGVTWIPPTGSRTARILGDLLTDHHPTGNLVTDAQLAAIAIEHGIAIVSTDTDFARFARTPWINPLAA